MALVNEDFDFRAVLIKIQNLLSTEDRLQLHFLFGEDIPRRLQSNGSLETALEALQVLFDRLKISKNNYDYLVRALQVIERPDCAERLLEYQKVIPRDIIPNVQENQEQVQSKLIVVGVPSLTRTPTIQDILFDKEEEDGILPLDTDAKITRFDSPEPDLMDFNNIDLEPFENSACSWTEEYSRLLNLPYNPRAYQIEVIRDAVKNCNTIICLRTGSGKTFIASIIIKYYFIKSQKTNPGAQFSCLFFVPRKAIRLQQAKAIISVGNMKVHICEDDQTIDQLIDKSHVIVATPQKFLNCLKDGTLRLSQINLMIFDECHNTSGGNPYCEIMKFYLCSSKGQNMAAKPRIIGLTATISAKDAIEKKETIQKNLVSLCSRLDCKTISTVCEPNNITEINCEISRPSNDQFEYVLKAQYNSYYEEYLETLDNLIKIIKKHLDGYEILDGQDVGSSSFIGQLVLLKRAFESKGDTNNIIICDYLLLLTKKYSSLKDLPFDIVLREISSKIQQYFEGYQQSVPMNNLLYQQCKFDLDALLQKYAEHPTTNSKLDNLIHLLKRHATKNTKGLILVQTTFYAKNLCDYVSAHQELKNIVKPIWIVGQNSADHSLTIYDQEGRLKKFREDECNVLIATDIVQEGLDIPTCSYVIRYEFVSDEIGTIQSRGRARAQNSSYYLITERDSMNHRRELSNKIREEYMENALNEWRVIRKDQFQRDVEAKARSLIIEWEKNILIEMKEKATIKAIGKKDGSICCRKCNRVLGEIAWLKKRNTMHFINNRAFFNDKMCKLDNVFENFQENLVMGKVLCCCGNSLGGCQQFLDRPELGTLCALKCTQVKFQIDYKKPYIKFPKWTKNDCFDIEELEEI